MKTKKEIQEKINEYKEQLFKFQREKDKYDKGKGYRKEIRTKMDELIWVLGKN